MAALTGRSAIIGAAKYRYDIGYSFDVFSDVDSDATKQRQHLDAKRWISELCFSKVDFTATKQIERRY